jgi:xylulokinase
LHLGIDLGTGSVKVLAVSDDGVEISASKEYEIHTPQKGFAETQTKDWTIAIASALAEIGPFKENVTLGFSGQMHGVVPCSRGDAIYPAILWNDARAIKELESLSDLDQEEYHRLMNNPSAGMALLSILWLKNNQKTIYDQTEFFLQPKDYIRYYLTAEALTEHSDAGATLLYDCKERNWFHNFLQSQGISSEKLPPISESFSQSAPILAIRAVEMGLPENTEIHLGGADTACALLGNGICNNKSIQLSIGTGAQIVCYSKTLPSFSPKLNTYPTVDGGWYTMAAHLNGGTFLEWLRRILGFSWEEVYTVFDSHSLKKWLLELQGLIFLPYINGERTPLMSADISGNLSGLKAVHTRNHIIMAALLGTLFAIRSGLELICEKENIPENQPLLATGGSFSHQWWTRLSATVLKHPLIKSERLNASAYGAVLIGAGKESDFYKSYSIPVKGISYEPETELYGIIDDMYKEFCLLSGI